MPRFRHVASLCTVGAGVVSLGVISLAAGAGADPAPAPGGAGSGAAIANTANTSNIHTGTCSPVQSVQTGNIINANGNGSGNGGDGGLASNGGGLIPVPGNTTGTATPRLAIRIPGNTATANGGNGGNFSPGNVDITQKQSVNCFNNNNVVTPTRTIVVPQTKTVVVPQTVTKTVVVPQTVVQQAPVASAVTTTAHFTG